MEQSGQVGLIGKDVAHRHPLLGDQHRQLGDRFRARPVGFEGLAVVLGRKGLGQCDGRDEVAGLFKANRLQDVLKRGKRLIRLVHRALHDFEEHRRDARILTDRPRQDAHVGHALGQLVLQLVQHARLGRNYDALVEQTADALIFFAGKVDHHSRGSRHKTGNVVEHRLAAPKYAILPAARGRRQAATAKTSATPARYNRCRTSIPF